MNENSMCLQWGCRMECKIRTQSLVVFKKVRRWVAHKMRRVKSIVEKGLRGGLFLPYEFLKHSCFLPKIGKFLFCKKKCEVEMVDVFPRAAKDLDLKDSCTTTALHMSNKEEEYLLFRMCSPHLQSYSSSIFHFCFGNDIFILLIRMLAIETIPINFPFQTL